LDDKIELNRRMNQTLESMARAIFRSWFVDFDPVVAKAEGRQPFGMSAEVAALFPNRFADQIPKGWRADELAALASNWRSARAPNSVSSEAPYVGLEHMPRRCIALSGWGAAGEVTSGKFEFERGDVLFGKLRPYFHKVVVAPVSGVCSTDILVVRPKTPQWFSFVLGHLSSDEFVAHTDAGSTGTKMPRTDWREMSRYIVTTPPGAVATVYDGVCRPMVEQITANIHQSRTLAALRDTLLPKLMSGELRVRDAQKLVGAHV
jgi:type I restriction enzyme S subunit